MGRNPRFLLVALAALAANVAIAFAVYRAAGIGIQIYSLAGMAVSLGIVAGNILVMAAHLAGQRGSRSFFTAILASTLTTVAPLVATRRLGKGVGPDLADFATITIVNLMVSLAVCLLLVPALMDVLGVERAVAARRRRPGRSTVRAMRAYSAFIAFTLARRRRAMVVLAVLAFGTPLFMLPHHIGSDDYTEYPPSPYVRLYNATIGSKAYEAVRQYSDPLLPRGRSRPFMMRYVAGRYDESPDDHRAPAPWRLRPYCRRAPAPHEADKACAAMERLLMNQGGAGAPRRTSPPSILPATAPSPAHFRLPPRGSAACRQRFTAPLWPSRPSLRRCPAPWRREDIPFARKKRETISPWWAAPWQPCRQ